LSANASPPEVSVVVAVRDGGPELLPSLRSVLDQEGVALELIVVDDGSKDATPAALRELAAADARVRTLRLEPSGITRALRAGCTAAQAPILARQDVGDRSLPGRLRAQLEAFARCPRLALVSSFTECLAPFGETLYLERGGGRPGAEEMLAPPAGTRERRIGPTSHGSACFRRDLYEACGGYRPDFALGQDWDLWYRLGERGTYLTVEATFYQRRLAPGSLSFRHRQLQLRFGAIGEEAARRRLRGENEETLLSEARALSIELSAESPSRARRAESLAWYHFGEVLRRRGDRAAARYLRAAIRAEPLLGRAWVRLAQCALAAAGREPVARE
jgi:glycosyltransferase involved in cell wall biosynthesis